MALFELTGKTVVVAGAGSGIGRATALIADADADGTLWGLVNNAGVMDLFAGVAKVDDGTWERCLRVNLTAPMYLMRAANDGGWSAG